MKQNILGSRNELHSTRPGTTGVGVRPCKRVQPAWALLALLGVSLVCAAPGAASAQHCRLHYSEAFRLIATQSFDGQPPAAIKQKVDDLFGPRQEVCGEGGYKFFLTELGAQASAALRKKGSEQESRLVATREIMNRFPVQVRFSNGAVPGAGLTQLRADLGVLSTEVGKTPAISALLEALGKVAPPRTLSKPLPQNDDAIPIMVPQIPLPAWAIISLYEIRDHAARKESAAITAKTSLILDWVMRASPGVRPIEPPAATQSPAKLKGSN